MNEFTTNLPRSTTKILRHYALTSIALAGNVEITVLVLGEPLEPFHQESVRIMGCK
jgi:hypothetical protein